MLYTASGNGAGFGCFAGTPRGARSGSSGRTLVCGGPGIRGVQDCAARGLGCEGVDVMAYVGPGQGQYVEENTYTYTGHGGDWTVVHPRRDYTCVVALGALVGLLLLVTLLHWSSSLFATKTTQLAFDCEEGVGRWRRHWSRAQQEYCCITRGRGCTTIAPARSFPVATPPHTAPMTAFPAKPPPTLPPMLPQTPPPTQPVTMPMRPVDPHNCAVDPEAVWSASKRAWCCRVHLRGCPPTPPPLPPPTMPPVAPLPPMPLPLPRPVDPYNCALGYENWVARWSLGKKSWCCSVHGRGCPELAPSDYDCDTGFVNWVNGWSVAKKAWCCQSSGKGCAVAVGGCT